VKLSEFIEMFNDEAVSSGKTAFTFCMLDGGLYTARCQEGQDKAWLIEHVKNVDPFKNVDLSNASDSEVYIPRDGSGCEFKWIVPSR